MSCALQKPELGISAHEAMDQIIETFQSTLNRVIYLNCQPNDATRNKKAWLCAWLKQWKVTFGTYLRLWYTCASMRLFALPLGKEILDTCIGIYQGTCNTCLSARPWISMCESRNLDLLNCLLHLEIMQSDLCSISIITTLLEIIFLQRIYDGLSLKTQDE